MSTAKIGLRLRALIGRFHLLQRNDGLGSGRRRNQYVGLGQRAFDLRQRQRKAAELTGQFTGPFDVAVRDEQPADLTLVQVFGDQFYRYAGADQQRGVLLEAGEELAGEVDGRGRYRNRACADLGVGTNFLGNCKGVLKQQAKLGAEAPGLLRLAKGVF